MPQDAQVTTHFSTNNSLFMKRREERAQASSEHELHTQEEHGLRSLINAEND